MFDQKVYLRSLGCDGGFEPTIRTLRNIHRAHIERFPFSNAEHRDLNSPLESRVDDVARIFENTEVLAGNSLPESIDIDLAFHKVVIQRRGGVCGELNGLFFRLLRELGFQAKIIYASNMRASGFYGPDFYHMMIVVTIDATRWLVDVGFCGFSFLEPLEIKIGEEQLQDGCRFRIVEQDYYLTVERKSRMQDWSPICRFSEDGPRDLTVWRQSEDFRATAGIVSTLRRRGLPGGGQLVMVDDCLLRVTDGNEEVFLLKEDFERRNAIAEIMGMPQ